MFYVDSFGVSIRNNNYDHINSRSLCNLVVGRETDASAKQLHSEICETQHQFFDTTKSHFKFIFLFLYMSGLQLQLRNTLRSDHTLLGVGPVAKAIQVTMKLWWTSVILLPQNTGQKYQSVLAGDEESEEWEEAGLEEGVSSQADSQTSGKRTVSGRSGWVSVSREWTLSQAALCRRKPLT